MVREKLEEFGTLLRFLTPILIAVIGWISIQYLSAINRKFDNIDYKFETFMQIYHNLDKRVLHLEDKVFPEGDKQREANNGTR